MLDALPFAADLLRPKMAAGGDPYVDLPAVAYTSPEVFDWEQRHLFEAGWVCVGRTDDLHIAGDQRALRIGREGVLLARGEDRALRGFFNVCRHRGHELLGPGASRNLRGIRCPYHAWVYRLDGTLGATPRFGEQGGFDKAAYPLLPTRTEGWRGWVFVNVAGQAPDLTEVVAGLDGSVAVREAERFVQGASRSYSVEANWKTISESHFGRNVAGSVSSTPEARDRPLHVGIFPNLLLSLGSDHVMMHRLEPVDPGRTEVDSRWLFPPEALGNGPVDPAAVSGAGDARNREDWLVCGAVQRELRFAGRNRRPSGWSREGVRSYVATVAKGYLAQGSSDPEDPEPARALGT